MPRTTQPTRKDAVLDAALTLFAQRGYHQTTIDDIGRELNLRGPSLYNHIESKYQVLVDIVTDFMLLGLDGQARVLSSTDDPVEQLRGLVDIHVSENAADPRQSHVATSELRTLEEPARTRVVELRAQYERNLLGVIERGVEHGTFHVTSPSLAVFAILAMGIHVSSWFDPNGPLTAADVSAAYQDFALNIVNAER